MNWFDFICLWLGYVICLLALLRCAIESVFATHRAMRRMIRWMASVYSIEAVIAATKARK